MTINNDLHNAAAQQSSGDHDESSWRINISTIISVVIGLITIVQGFALWWITSMSTTLQTHETRLSRVETSAEANGRRIDQSICDIKDQLKLILERQISVLQAVGRLGK